MKQCLQLLTNLPFQRKSSGIKFLASVGIGSNLDEIHAVMKNGFLIGSYLENNILALVQHGLCMSLFMLNSRACMICVWW